MIEPADDASARCWRRKTAAENAADHRAWRRARWNPANPLAVAVLVAALIVLMETFIGNPRRGSPPIPFVRAVSHFLPMATVVFVGMYLWRIWTYAVRRPPSLLVICTKCHAIHDREAPTCPCGGPVEEITRWTRNRCPHCRYDLRASTKRCPECGRPVDPPKATTPPRPHLTG